MSLRVMVGRGEPFINTKGGAYEGEVDLCLKEGRIENGKADHTLTFIDKHCICIGVQRTL